MTSLQRVSKGVNTINQLIFVRSLSYNANIDFSKLKVQKATSFKFKRAYDDLQFGKDFTDHMLEVDWDQTTGWEAPRIHPFQNLSLSPAASVLHYGIECFEGMKAYKGPKGEIRLFRPDKNMERLNSSMVRLGMPAINGSDGFLQSMKELLKIDESWIPNKDGCSLYIRPTAIGTSPVLGVHASELVKLFTILSPVGPYYKSGFVPVKLLADDKNVRAWPGGAGNTKVGGNYGPTIEPSKKAAALGCSQVLWLFGEDHQITEVGAMNIFFLLKKKNSNVTELVTAPLTRGDILPGVTRASVLEMTRGWKEFEVNERWLTMGEVVEAQKEGRLLEAFGAGTAVVVSPVRSIVYKDKEITIPTGDQAGPVASKVWKSLTDIQYGRVPDHPWSVVVK